MLIEYIKIAWRNMKRHKGYTFVNILGLTAGMFCVSLYMLLILHEYSYDSFHKDADQIYLVYIEDHSTKEVKNIAWTPYQLAKSLKENFKEVEYSEIIYKFDSLVSSKYNKFYEFSLCQISPNFFEIFSYKVLMGNPQVLLPDSNSVVITDKAVKKYFGDQNPIGKKLILDNKLEVEISGVIKIPENSFFNNINFFLTPESSMILNYQVRKWKKDWTKNLFFTIIKINKAISPNQMEKKIFVHLNNHNPIKNYKLKLKKFKYIHLSDLIITNQKANNHIFPFLLISTFILIIACINFINLATAHIEKKYQEIEFRKSLGAQNIQVITQYLVEFILFLMISFIFTMILLDFLLSFFNGIWQRQFSINYLDASTIAGFFIVIFLTLAISSPYPAYILTLFKPFAGYKKRYFHFSRSTKIRNLLLLIQFVVSTILIIFSQLIYTQVKFSKSMTLGIDIKNIVWVYFDLSTQQNKNLYQVTKKALIENPKIQGVTSSINMPFYSSYFNFKVNWEGKKPGQKVLFGIWDVDEDFIPTYNLNFIRGRNFIPDNPADVNNVILNEEAVRQMGLKSPIGKEVVLNVDKRGKIIGIIKNFHSQSMKNNLKPLILCQNYLNRNLISIRLSDKNHSDQIKYIKNIWKKYNPASTCDFKFLSDKYKNTYRDEGRISKILFFFSLLSILISSLGVFALSYLTVERRTKEIGIRKAVGSTVREIVWLISKDIIKWVFISTLFSWPIAYIIMRKWLNQYAYHTPLTIWPFLIASAIILVITVITASIHAIRAANANPVDALRDE